MGRRQWSVAGFPISFDVIGMFAGRIRTHKRIGRSKKQAVGTFMEMQGASRIICRACGQITDSLAVWTRERVEDLWHLAQKVEWPEYRTEVARQYLGFEFECPECGARAGLEEFGTGEIGSLDIATR